MTTQQRINSPSTMNNSSWKLIPLIVIIVPIILSIVAQIVLFTGVEAPPSTFGTGSMFDSIASRYDSINRVLSMGMDIGWRRTMVNVIQDSVQNNKHPQLLDLATGTADVAIQLTKQIPHATIVGIDPSQNMLSIGRHKVHQQNLDDIIDLRLGDAQNLSTLKRQSFDGATMAFGIRNVPDRNKALCQIHSVLKKNSKFCILEFSEPDYSTGGFIGAYLATYFVRYVIPIVGGILSGSPREYWHLQKSINDFPKPNDFVTSVQQLQCPDGTKRRFDVDNVVHMNFGVVQLYIMTRK
jgi:demethylmenaquinone methyltransferase / 2-methoxy-6-polyprenyl-1,4-benzoquinol methylase